MDKQISTNAMGGIFYFKHYRNDKLIAEGKQHNVFVKEGLVYALNSAFAVSVGGAPSPLVSWYVGLSTANRQWNENDDAANVHNDSNEFQGYSESTRQLWLPQDLAIPSNIHLSNVNAEATYNITTSATLYGGFIISNGSKAGTGDTGSILAAGANFNDGVVDTPRAVLIGDVFKVGYVLSTEDKV